MRFPNRTELREQVSIKGTEMKQKYKLETITPVHIGSGETLNHIDGYYANRRWYHINLDKVLEHPATDINALTSEMSQRDFRWSDYFSRHNMNGAELSTYSLLCAQSPETTDIREAIKSVGNRPYIPGSSIKGAIRTALLSDLINNAENEKLYNDSSKHLNREIDKGAPSKRRQENPAQQIEELAFGKDPNHDLLRALQVSDTEPLESEALAIETAWTVTLNQNNQLEQKIEGNTEYKNFVEVLQGVQTLTFTLKIDELLFRDRERKKLKFSELQEKTLREMADVCKFESKVLMQDEQYFFQEYSFTEIANLYDKFINLNNSLTDGAFMLQIGWGTGYLSNTVTGSFTEGEEAPIDVMKLRERYRLGRSRSNQHDPYDPREFPKTRRILYRGPDPKAPLGWVKISPLTD